MQVFSKEWFKHYQSKLLWLLNAPIIGRWFRWVLCIHDDQPIKEIRPNSYTTHLRDLPDGAQELVGYFNVDLKYAKRLYHAFFPLWFLMHWWDELLADQWIPKVSFGFRTLYTTPAQGSGGGLPIDMTVGRANSPINESFSTIRAGAGTEVDLGTVFLNAASTTNQFNELTRGAYLFATNVHGSLQSITSASFTFYNGFDNITDFGNATVDIVSSFPAAIDNITTSDYQNFGSTSFGSASLQGVLQGSFTTINLNASGLANLNMSGTSKFGARLGWDTSGSFTGTWVSGGYTIAYIQEANPNGAANGPVLKIVYVMGGSNQERFAADSGVSATSKIGGL